VSSWSVNVIMTYTEGLGIWSACCSVDHLCLMLDGLDNVIGVTMIEKTTIEHLYINLIMIV